MGFFFRIIVYDAFGLNRNGNDCTWSELRYVLFNVPVCVISILFVSYCSLISMPFLQSFRTSRRKDFLWLQIRRIRRRKRKRSFSS